MVVVLSVILVVLLLFSLCRYYVLVRVILVVICGLVVEICLVSFNVNWNWFRFVVVVEVSVVIVLVILLWILVVLFGGEILVIFKRLD